MKWLKDKIKRFWKWLIALFVIPMVFAAPPVINNIQINALPAHLKLQAPDERILEVVFLNANDVMYAKRSLHPSPSYPNEVNRTNNSVTQRLVGDKFVVTNFVGQRFYRETRNHPWYDVTYATTTKKAFKLQSNKAIKNAFTRE